MAVGAGQGAIDVGEDVDLGGAGTVGVGGKEAFEDGLSGAGFVRVEGDQWLQRPSPPDPLSRAPGEGENGASSIDEAAHLGGSSNPNGSGRKRRLGISRRS